MRGRLPVGLVVLGLVVGACEENVAPGNDREAQLSPAEVAAQVTSVGAAIAGVATDLLIPQTMLDADLQNLPGGERCLLGFTRVGLPVLAYGPTAVLKLNDKLVLLPSSPSGDGRYAADDVSVSVRPIEDDPGNGEPFATEFVLRLPEAGDELGYHGYSRCTASSG